MAQFPIRIPKVSSAAFEATLVTFLVEEGQKVAGGDALFEVETDKVETEIESAKSGVVHWSAKPGEIYEVGTQIGYIDLDGDG